MSSSFPPTPTFPQGRANQTMYLSSNNYYLLSNPTATQTDIYSTHHYPMEEVYLQGNWELLHMLLGPRFLIQLGPIPFLDTAALFLVGNRIKTSPQFGRSSLPYSPKGPSPFSLSLNDQHSFSPEFTHITPLTPSQLMLTESKQNRIEKAS